MKVKDIVKTTATYLGKENVTAYLSSAQNPNYGDAAGEVDLLTRCTNLVLNELACSYVPMIKTEHVSTETGKIDFSSLNENAIEILSVKTDGGEELKFKIKAECLEVGYSEFNVHYKYLPSNYGLTDYVGYSEKDLPSRVIAYGVAAECTLYERNFDESVMWRKRFSDALSSLTLPKNYTVKKRSFI